MKLSTQAYKGTRDFYPEDMQLRNWMFGKWREVCASFGYEEYDAPILEPLELFTAKTSEEIVNEQTYTFTDRGDRKVVMRPEMTPSVSRMVAARRQELAYPSRLFSIPNCFRYERPQRGRLREFWQLNADIFGVEGLDADIEMIQLADELMKSFGATSDMYEIRINSRKLLNQKITESGVKTDVSNVMRLIDALDKMEATEFKAKLAQLVDKPDDLYEFLSSSIDNDDLNVLAKQLESAGVKVKISASLARGFDYYTDIVFEVFDKNPENNRSMFGGGRYDGLVGEFGVEPIPTVGFGMGDVTMENFLRSNNLIPDLRSDIDVSILTIGDVSVQKLASELRGQGINVRVDSTDRKLDKKIKAADKSGVRYALFVGETELKSGEFKLKDLKSGDESNQNIQGVVRALQDFRK